MGIDIQWERLAPVSGVGNVLAGYEAGDKMHTKTVTQNALAMYDKDPDGAVKALMPVNPEAALQLRTITRQDRQDAGRQKAASQYAAGDMAGATTTAIAGGDFDMAKQIAALTKEQRSVAQQHAEALGAYAHSLKGLPYEQAKARIQADTPMLMQRGFKPQELAAFDPTPQNLDAVIGQAMDLKTALDQADKQADNARADKQFGETQRHNQVSESVSAGNLGVARGNLGVRRQEFNERKKAKGFGTPGAAFDPNAIAWDN